MATLSAQDRGQSLTIREADDFGKVKCNRCKKKLRGGPAGDAQRDRTKPGYICAGGC